MYESSDLYFSEEGDYVLDRDGDVMDTFSDPFLALGQVIRDRCRYTVGSHRLSPRVGVLTLPFGLYNFAENAEEYRKMLILTLTEDGIILPEDLEVDIVSIDDDTWLISVAISLHPSVINSTLTERVFFLTYQDSNSQIRFF